MKLFLASALLTGFGFGSFEVDPPSITIEYQQNQFSLNLPGTDLLGGTIGGYFSSTQNWQEVGKLGIRASISGANPNSFFSVELYSGDPLELVGLYQATTESLGNSGNTGEIELALVQAGPGNPADIRGMQFTWEGGGSPVNFSMYNWVDMETISPKITYYGITPSGFSLKWVGTGANPVNIERSTDLSSGQWTIIATGVTSREFTDPSTPVARAFYRVSVP